MTIEELNEKITKQQTQIDELKSKVLSYESSFEELDEKIKKQQIQIDELKSEVLSYESSFGDINNAINALSSRIGDIENNGIKNIVGDLQDDIATQRLKLNKLDRIRKGLA